MNSPRLYPQVTKAEFHAKVNSLRSLMEEKQARALVVRRQANFSWLTGGRGFVGLASEMSCGTLVITRDRVHLVTSVIEAPRLGDEEVPADFGVAVAAAPWHDGVSMGKVMAEIAGENPLSEDAVGRELQRLRSQLCAAEVKRYRWLGMKTAQVVEAVCGRVRQGQSEFAIAGLVSAGLWKLGIEPITVMVATDERIHKYRHPIPTAKKLERYCMIVVCSRRAGLVASVTRLVHLGPVPSDVEAKMKAVTAIDTAMNCLTRPGARIADIFDRATKAYASTGYADEWKLHHKGGLAGYSAREYIGTPSSQECVLVNQAFAWNPSISGVKSEDTIVVLEGGNEVLTHTGGYPYVECAFEGQSMLRPGILVR